MGTGSFRYYLLLSVVLAKACVSRSFGLVQNSYRIVGIPGAGTQLLPESYIKGIRRWTLDDSGNDLVVVPNSPGLTNPKRDLQGQRIQIRPTLDVLVKSGVPSYVMAGLQVRHEKADEEDQSSQALEPPLTAEQWTTFAMAVDPSFRITVYMGPSDGTDDRVAMADHDLIQHALERLGLFLSQATEELSGGFHIVALPLEVSWTRCSVNSVDDILTCLATAEPDARELLTLDQGLVEMTASSVLQVTLSDL
jgi:hypothetical protein